MLKKIPTRQLRLGMHIHEVCGSWLEHPFWRRGFALKDARQLAQLQASVTEVVIDTAKGLDVVPEPPVASEPAEAGGRWVDDVELPDSPEGLWPPLSPAASGPLLHGPATLHDELDRARRIVGEAGAEVQALFTEARLGRALDTHRCLPLVAEITGSVQRHPGALISLARLKTSDDYTFFHSVAVCALMVALARQIGLPEDDCRQAGLAGLLHDMGKALMPPEVLNKPGALTADEFATMKRHPQAGFALLQGVPGIGPIPLDVALHHHEKLDGRGYPKGLRGEQVSRWARMGAICDVYDAITSNRPYKSGWDPAQSLQKMAQWARDGHFDEALFQAFVKCVGIYPTGSLVRLRSQRLAVVVEQGVGGLLQPTVVLCLDAATRQPLPRASLDLADPRVDDAIVARERPEAWGLTDLDALWQHASG